MPLKLNDLMGKAAKKGFKITPRPAATCSFIKPWQSESIIYNNDHGDENELTTNIKPIPNQHQTDTKPTSNRYQTNIKPIPNKTKLVSNQHQTTDKTDIKTNTNIGFFSLTGLQKEITIFIYALCKISRNKKTDATSISQISIQCRSTIGAVKVAIYRLIEKGILQREEFKNGRGGWTVYSIPNNTYQEIITIENNGKLISNWNQTNTKLVTEVIPYSPSSSSININTTTYKNEQQKIDSKWLNIDIESLSFIGFTETHLKQIAIQNILTPQIIQDSIYAYAFDLEKNNKAKSVKGDPLSYFMGIVRKGRPYAPPANYESPQDRDMRLYLERKREIEQRRTDMRKEEFDLVFKEWFYNITDNELRKIIPSAIKCSRESIMTEGMAREYFKKNVWEKRNELEYVAES